MICIRIKPCRSYCLLPFSLFPEWIIFHTYIFYSTFVIFSTATVYYFSVTILIKSFNTLNSSVFIRYIWQFFDPSSISCKITITFFSSFIFFAYFIINVILLPWCHYLSCLSHLFTGSSSHYTSVWISLIQFSCYILLYFLRVVWAALIFLANNLPILPYSPYNKLRFLSPSLLTPDVSPTTTRTTRHYHQHSSTDTNTKKTTTTTTTTANNTASAALTIKHTY